MKRYSATDCLSVEQNNMTDDELISKVRKHLSVSRKAGILSASLLMIGLILFLTLLSNLVLIIDPEKNGTAFWGAFLLGMMAGWIFFCAAGMLALNLTVVFRRGFIFRALNLLLQYHEEKK
jgi:hypothetical protein